jgi:hypothetical protein
MPEDVPWRLQSPPQMLDHQPFDPVGEKTDKEELG